MFLGRDSAPNKHRYTEWVVEWFMARAKYLLLINESNTFMMDVETDYIYLGIDTINGETLGGHCTPI